MFKYLRDIHVYETDLMGIVHHSNYLRYCEEARVEWCKSNGLLLPNQGDRTQAVFGLTVYETRVKHIKPARYGDRLQIAVQVKVEGVRIIFQYKITLQDTVLSLAETVHCNIDTDFKVRRVEKTMVHAVKESVWTETWL